MNIYWYWPHPHRTSSALAAAMLAPGDTLVVQSLEQHGGEPLPDSGYPYRVVRDLPARQHARGEGRVRRLLGSLVVDVRRSARRRRLVRSASPDIIHLQLLRFATDWLDLRRLSRRHPVVAVVHDVIPHHRTLPRCLEDRLHRLLYHPSCTPDLVVHHASLSRLLEERYGVDRGRVHVLPMPVVRPADVASARSAQGRTVLLLGSLRENKGVGQYLRVLEELSPLPDVTFHIAGAGPSHLEQAVRAVARKVPGITAEIGHYSERRKWELLGSADFVVLPYTSDFVSHSAVLMDAYSHGVPVIATDVGGLGESVREEGTGWLARPDDQESLRNAIVLALSDREGYLARRACVSRAAEAHDVSIVGPLLRRVYEQAVGRRG